MNVGQITMRRSEARRRLAQYRGSKHAETDQEYRAAITAYEALARGTPIVVLSQAFALASLDDKGRPKLALARADERQVRLHSWNGVWRFQHPDWRRHQLFLRARTREISDARASSGAPDGFALVPIVPPDVRGNHALDAHWILWEVDQWADQQIGMRADRDPLLLRHLVGEAYAVVGQWDLTDVERAIMAETRKVLR